jgi:AcrR family transcriptional regulator
MNKKKRNNSVRKETDDRSDERVEKSKRAVLAATFQLLAEEGISGVSVDEVSRRSGVAKTTVYRHWPSRSALLIDACSSLASANLESRPGPPDTGHFKTDLLMLLNRMAGRLRSERWATILPSMIDAAERDPELAKVYVELHRAFMAPLYAIIERAKKRGELGASCDASEVVAAVVGPLFYRRWFSRQTMDEKFVRGIVERVVGESRIAKK